MCGGGGGGGRGWGGGGGRWAGGRGGGGGIANPRGRGRPLIGCPRLLRSAITLATAELPHGPPCGATRAQIQRRNRRAAQMKATETLQANAGNPPVPRVKHRELQILLSTAPPHAEVTARGTCAEPSRRPGGAGVAVRPRMMATAPALLFDLAAMTTSTSKIPNGLATETIMCPQNTVWPGDEGRNGPTGS